MLYGWDYQAAAAAAAACCRGCRHGVTLALALLLWLLVDGCWLPDLLAGPAYGATSNVILVWARETTTASATDSRCMPTAHTIPHVSDEDAGELAWLALLHRPGYVDDTSSSPLKSA